MLAGRSVVTGSLVGLGNPLVKVSLVIFWACWVILVGLVLPCWMVLLSSDITLWVLPVGSVVSLGVPHGGGSVGGWWCWSSWG